MEKNTRKNVLTFEQRVQLVADRRAHSIQQSAEEKRDGVWYAYHLQAWIIRHHWGGASPERKAEATAELLASTKRRIAQLG